MFEFISLTYLLMTLMVINSEDLKMPEIHEHQVLTFEYGYLPDLALPKQLNICQLKYNANYTFVKINDGRTGSLGAHVLGEEVSYAYSGTIPAFTPVFTLHVTPDSSLGFEKRFTYLKVHYVNPISKVVVSFDPETMILTIHQKFPFLSMPFGVHGYSMPTTLRKLFDNYIKGK